MGRSSKRRYHTKDWYIKRRERHGNGKRKEDGSFVERTGEDSRPPAYYQRAKRRYEGSTSKDYIDLESW